MVVRLRLARFGRTHTPTYRIVAADVRCKRDGRHIEQVGSYDPIPRKDGTKEVRLNSERIKYWLSVGAQPSDRVNKLLGMAGLVPVAPQQPRTLRSIPKSQREFGTSARSSRDACAIGVIGSGMPLLPIKIPSAMRLSWRGSP
mmetsp:Transcript_28722/g.64184  ORF Transcript_28722/g.64184 Transcript_28722/m.64184 type:complete len:143 (+) Transcript_28722:69-497(+)|eukprot:CAMPEP_0172595524 /NCGR_PEP_ID=MMETSP1068-20121228/15113_1 /TAXON_ID=35684 /ORGANISM="Pseudopedinella elastica, Strain CCMP716" /LENGTH=142 /DNA_ID=CAMNT_0013394097 /DNA_START=1 /DNA_END=429 /DNA_ORIENTATION=-